MVIRSTPALTPTEKRRILRDARASGTLTWPLLDRLLLAAARTPAALAALVRSLAVAAVAAAGRSTRLWANSSRRASAYSSWRVSRGRRRTWSA